MIATWDPISLLYSKFLFFDKRVLPSLWRVISQPGTAKLTFYNWLWHVFIVF